MPNLDTHLPALTAKTLTATDVNDDGLLTQDERVSLLTAISNQSTNPNVIVREPKTTPLDLRLVVVISSDTNIATPPIVGGYDIELEAGHGFSAGDNIAITEEIAGVARFVTAVVESETLDVLTLTSPIPYGFSVAATVVKYDPDMSVNGAVTPVVYGLTNNNTTSVHVTRITTSITTTSEMDDSLFGDIDELSRGIVFRKKHLDGSYQYYFTAKNNGQIGLFAGGDKEYADKAPAGYHGMTARISYAGASKRGVVIELKTGESIEMLIQDDLSGLNSFNVLATGHFAEI